MDQFRQTYPPGTDANDIDPVKDGIRIAEWQRAQPVPVGPDFTRRLYTIGGYPSLTTGGGLTAAQTGVIRSMQESIVKTQLSSRECAVHTELTKSGAQANSVAAGLGRAFSDWTRSRIAPRPRGDAAGRRAFAQSVSPKPTAMCGFAKSGLRENFGYNPSLPYYSELRGHLIGTKTSGVDTKQFDEGLLR